MRRIPPDHGSPIFSAGHTFNARHGFQMGLMRERLCRKDNGKESDSYVFKINYNRMVVFLDNDEGNNR